MSNQSISQRLQELRREFNQVSAELAGLSFILGPSRAAFREEREALIEQLCAKDYVNQVILSWRAPTAAEMAPIDEWGRHNHIHHRAELEQERALKELKGQLKRQIDAAENALKKSAKKTPTETAQMRLF